MAVARLLLFLLFLPAALHGQQIILTGRVLDPSGNTLSNATIHVSPRTKRWLRPRPVQMVDLQ